MTTPTIRKDMLGQDINAGDVIVYGDSSQYSQTKVAMVLKYNPKLLGTSSGSTSHSNCVVITAQMKHADPKRYQDLYEANKDKFVTVDSYKAPKAKKEYRLGVKFLTQNHCPDPTQKKYWGVELQVRVYHDGQEQHKSTTLPAMKPNVYEGYDNLTRHYEKVEEGLWKRSVKSGKVALNSDSYSRSGKDSLFAAKQIKSVLDNLPTTSVSIPFADLEALTVYLHDKGVQIATDERYGRGLNKYGQILKNLKLI